MGAEVKRQAWTEVLTQAPAQMAQRAWTFIVSGAIYQPRNIIMGMVLLSGWVMGGWLLCSRGEQKDIAESWQSKSGNAKFDLSRQMIAPTNVNATETRLSKK